MNDDSRARRGDWWHSGSGGLYCVQSVEYGKRGLGASVAVYWITGHTPPRVHDTYLYAGQWRNLVRHGTRLKEPPTVNIHGHDITAQVADVLGRLAQGGAA
jgi:hypothetical protein